MDALLTLQAISQNAIFVVHGEHIHHNILLFPPAKVPKFGECPIYGSTLSGFTHTHAKPLNKVYSVATL